MVETSNILEGWFYRLLVALTVSGSVPVAAYTQSVMELPTVRRTIDLTQDPASEARARRFGERLTSNERHLIAPLDATERQRLQEPHDPPRIGVVRTLPSELALQNVSLEGLGQEGRSIGGGLIVRTADSVVVWTTYVRSQGANALRILFSTSYLPRGSMLFIYNNAGETHGPYTFAGLLPEGGFWSNAVFSDHAFVELQVGAAALDSIPFTRLLIRDVLHIEHETFRMNPNDGCLQDVNCSYANQFTGINSLKEATARYSFVDGGSAYLCSGGLLSSTASSDAQPFLLTANHCVSSQTVARTVEAYFDYRTTSCNGTLNPNYQTVLRANLCSTSGTSDFTLLLLEGNPPAPRTYLGWSTQTIPDGTQLHSVHHPNGTPQKYTRATKNTPQTQCSGASAANFHYARIDSGATQGGSSGGVIVNSATQVVGQLLGICPSQYTECDFTTYHTVWGRFDVSYSSNNLHYWLVSGARASISVLPSSLDFGSIPSGTNSNRSLSVSNTSSVPTGLNLATGPAYITGPDASQFSVVEGNSLYIPPGSSDWMTIRFSPTSPGPKTATLNIPHNVPGSSNPIAVQLAGTGTNPIPAITSLSPSSATAGDPGFSLTVNGSGFILSSVVRWNAVNRSTTFISASQLNAAISAADIVNPGTISVTVFNPPPGGGSSNPATFTVNYPVPMITHLDPASRPVGGPAFTLSVYGQKFFPASRVRWNGSDRSTSFVSNTRLDASISASDIAVVGTATVTVVNPAPGGGESNPAAFTIVPTVQVTVDQRRHFQNRQLTGTQVGRWEGGPDFAHYTVPIPQFTFLVGSREVLQGKQDTVTDPVEKYRVWERNQVAQLDTVQNHRGFTIDPQMTELTSRFHPTDPSITIKTDLLDAPGTTGGNIRFRDPWYIDFQDTLYGNNWRNRGMQQAVYWDRQSPFYPNFTDTFAQSPHPYRGVFLNQSGPSFNWQPPYYSVGAPRVNTFTIGA